MPTSPGCTTVVAEEKITRATTAAVSFPEPPETARPIKSPSSFIRGGAVLRGGQKRTWVGAHGSMNAQVVT